MCGTLPGFPGPFLWCGDEWGACLGLRQAGGYLRKSSLPARNLSTSSSVGMASTSPRTVTQRAPAALATSRERSRSEPLSLLVRKAASKASPARAHYIGGNNSTIKNRLRMRFDEVLSILYGDVVNSSTEENKKNRL